jgi:hypothetical protein
MKGLPYLDLIKQGNDISYQDLLGTYEWYAKRAKIIERDKKHCTRCHYSETFGHWNSTTYQYTYITDNGKEEEICFTNEAGLIVRENMPLLIVTDKPYHLQVHHTYYVYKQLPWKYDDSALVTLCNWCHAKLHKEEVIVMYSDNNLKSFENLIPCNRCSGTGYFDQFKHVQSGICFECRGARFTTQL